mmetsp:Transcript_27241/g.82732  ORF Transcript_27241/g.82732 Transcript_27241/m.82732 type:complete len:118 (-) Transcript_27241:1725-2078(-)|eukprot:scaffold305597_cov24-Tisochrysis_lutea.AAC.2
MSETSLSVSSSAHSVGVHAVAAPPPFRHCPAMVHHMAHQRLLAIQSKGRPAADEPQSTSSPPQTSSVAATATAAIAHPTGKKRTQCRRTNSSPWRVQGILLHFVVLLLLNNSFNAAA